MAVFICRSLFFSRSPAKAGAHRSAPATVDEWVPAYAGTIWVMPAP
jgi:hypothetical protein